MTATVLSALTVLAIAVGFAFGRNYETERRKPKPSGAVLDLRPNEWSRVA